MLRSVAHGLRRLARRHDFERDLDDEVRFFLEQAAREHERAGLSPVDAARAARRDFTRGGGSVESVKERVRDAGWEAHVERLWADLLYAARSLRRSRAFTAVAALTLTLGIALDTTMFSVVRAVLLRPLPYADAGHLAMLWTDDPARALHREPTASRTVDDWRRESARFAGMAIHYTAPATIVGGEEPERTQAAFVSANLFAVLGVAPLLGRPLTDADERGAERVAVISHALWQRRYGGDSAVVGRALSLGDMDKGGARTLRIVGVMPDGFYFPDHETQFWEPATLYWRWERESVERFDAWARRWGVVARLRPGATLPEARAEMATIGRRLAQSYPSTDPDFPGFDVSVVPMLEHVVGPTLPRALWVLLGAVGLVLLIACANVANLLLARGAARERELAIRAAIGAGRGRLLRQLLVESLVIGLGAGLAGAALAVAGVRVVPALSLAGVPRLDELRVDRTVLAFAGVVSLAAVLAFGLLPAWKLSRRDPADALHGRRGGGGERATGGPGLLHTRALLVVAQCALVMVLLSGAGLLVRSYLHLRAVDPGFEPDRALLVRVGLPLPEPARRERTEADRVTAQQRQLARRVELMQAVVDRVRALPGVTRAGWIDNLLIRGEADESITIPGRPAESLAPGHLASTAVGPDLLPALGVPLRRGRMLGPADAAAQIRLLWGPLQPAGRSLEEQARTAGAEPVVVNEAFVRRYFPGEDAVGRRFCISPTNKTYWYEIVGVVGDMHRQGLERPAIPEYFVSFVARQSADLVVRTSGDPLVLAAAVRGVVRGAERGALILEVTTVDARLGALSAQRRFHTALLSTFALLALGLAAVGIYGVVHYVVAQRTREMGVRAALGASGAAVQRLVVGEAMRLPLVGLAIGVAGAALLDRLLARLLFGVSPLDPLTHVVVAAVLSLTALGACWLPARRAARVDPVIALRED